MALTTDSAELRKLTRTQLQSLAKREGVRAVGKTEDIIHRLIQKHPEGVPIPEDANNPSASIAPPKLIPQHETNLVMDSPKLRELNRVQLQSLAKREGIRAVGKTVDIIRRLMQKHPRGVPIPEDTDNPSASSAPPKRNILKKSRKGAPSPPPVQATPEVRPDPKGKGKQVAQATSPSSSSSTEVLEELLYPEDEPVAGPSNTNVAPHPEVTKPEVLPDHAGPFSGERFTAPPTHQAHNEDEDRHDGTTSPDATVPGWRAEDEEEEPENVYDNLDYPKGAPNHYMVVDALRQFTTLVNAIPSMETRIAESQCLLQRAESLLDKAIPKARELAVTREYLEMFTLGKMKEKREIWDGTGKMEKQDRKLRMEWLRSERKAEREKKWREVNELYRRHGLPPEPFSAFGSESDEEVIESLQTTPTSSRNGNPKRKREESVDGETDGDANADGQSRRKRARL